MMLHALEVYTWGIGLIILLFLIYFIVESYGNWDWFVHFYFARQGWERNKTSQICCIYRTDSVEYIEQFHYAIVCFQNNAKEFREKTLTPKYSQNYPQSIYIQKYYVIVIAFKTIHPKEFKRGTFSTYKQSLQKKKKKKKNV